MLSRLANKTVPLHRRSRLICDHFFVRDAEKLAYNLQVTSLGLLPFNLKRKLLRPILHSKFKFGEKRGLPYPSGPGSFQPSFPINYRINSCPFSLLFAKVLVPQ